MSNLKSCVLAQLQRHNVCKLDGDKRVPLTGAEADYVANFIASKVGAYAKPATGYSVRTNKAGATFGYSIDRVKVSDGQLVNDQCSGVAEFADAMCRLDVVIAAVGKLGVAYEPGKLTLPGYIRTAPAAPKLDAKGQLVNA